MGRTVTNFDDVDPKFTKDITTHKFVIDEGEEVFELDLSPVTWEALSALLKNRDPELLRQVFNPPKAVHRNHEEMQAIRDAARAARNPDGTPMFADISDRGRIPLAIETWYNTEYLPAQEAAAHEAVEAGPEATPGEQAELAEQHDGEPVKSIEAEEAPAKRSRGK